MSGIFHRQLAEYADYHLDQRNCLMHIIGNPILFVAAVLPLSLLSVTAFGVQTSAAVLLVIPALILWMSWDVGLGLAIVVAAIPLLLIAAIIANRMSVAAVWIITTLLTVIGWALQIVGHQFFEQRRPALLDNPIHTRCTCSQSFLLHSGSGAILPRSCKNHPHSCHCCALD